MKSRGDFSSAEEFEQYLVFYYTGFALQAVMLNPNNVRLSEAAIAKKAIELAGETVQTMKVNALTN